MTGYGQFQTGNRGQQNFRVWRISLRVFKSSLDELVVVDNLKMRSRDTHSVFGRRFWST